MCRVRECASGKFYSTHRARGGAPAPARLQSVKRSPRHRHVRPRLPRPTATLATASTVVSIGSLDQEGRGIARVDGKAVFVEDALPGEVVAITTLKRKPTYDVARADRDR